MLIMSPPEKWEEDSAEKYLGKLDKFRVKFQLHYPLTDLAKWLHLKFLFVTMGKIMLTPHRAVKI